MPTEIVEKKETTQVINGIKFIIEIGEQEIPQEVLEHISRNVVAATNGASRCVDGRYLKDEMIGRLARPGGDLGIAMTLIKLGLSSQRAYDLITEYRKFRQEKVGWHNDDHNSHGAGCGCGHCNKAMMTQNAEVYGLAETSIREIEELWRLLNSEYQKNQESFDFVNLRGGHLESGVLQVEGVDFTIAPFDQETGKQFFIYDAKRDKELLENFFYFLKDEFEAEGEDVDIDGNKFSFAQLVEADAAMRNATLGLLDTAKDKPIYKVNADDYQRSKVVRISFAGRTPNLTKSA